MDPEVEIIKEIPPAMEGDVVIASLPVRIGMNKIPVNALLDTGANRLALDDQMVDRAGTNAIQVAPFTVKGGGGKVNCYPSAV